MDIFDGKTDDGLAFYLAPVGYPIPPNSAGAYFGLLNSTTVSDVSRNQIVMDEFDSYPNAPPATWDPTRTARRHQPQLHSFRCLRRPGCDGEQREDG
ncbi:hypothetical protein TIFTF001_009505 [Ficus carica]|uniref:Legume lectin domain-containing protein n=1 Tax=Ficus carica TaxID=3494 RepID=A0AA88DHH9_FICCA|nr:hypothetical protein TIFTF001_009505 [Ficus carica]